MKMKMAVLASLLLVSVQTASTQYYYVNPYSGPNSFYYQYYWDSPAAEDDLAYTKARRDKARKERELTGKSDKIEQFIALMQPLGLVEVVRTGIAAISRGVERLRV